MGKVYDAIIGLAVGDALGVPYEFQKRYEFNCTGMIGYGTHFQEPGTWSDDTSMTLATLYSIAWVGHVDLEDIMNTFVCWYVRGAFTAHGEVFDIGKTTNIAISKYLLQHNIFTCGQNKITDNGNGSLMRILPLAFVDSDVSKVSSLTHAHYISSVACQIYVKIASEILKGRTLEEARDSALSQIDDERFDRLKHIEYLPECEINSDGFVIHTLEAALWCLMTSQSYKETVLKAVNLGEDTDTTAAVAGGIAGLIYGIDGEKGIPKQWIKLTACHRQIKKLCKIFERRIK